MQLTFVALMGCLRFLHKLTAPGPKENRKKRDGGREGEERTLEGRREKEIVRLKDRWLTPPLTPPT